MDRSDSYIRMLDAFARYQGNIALILEAKAVESEKSRSWLCEYVKDGAFSDHKEQLKQCGHVHEKLIEVIDGIVKMEYGFARNMKTLLGRDTGGAESAGGGMFGDMYGGGSDG